LGEKFAQIIRAANSDLQRGLGDDVAAAAVRLANRDSCAAARPVTN
jgi:hypothetical protein